jgi:hypothetical protein
LSSSALLKASSFGNVATVQVADFELVCAPSTMSCGSAMGCTFDGGIYVEGGQETWWGKGPAWWKQEVQEYFYQNARMYLDDYRADGLRFDATTQINGLHLRNVIGRLRDEFPSRYIVAEHLPDDPWITGEGRFAVTWCADVHHETQRALAGQDSVRKVRDVLGWDGYDHAWNLVKYALGSHDDIGDQQDGDAEGGRSTGIGAIATSSTNSAAATTGPHGRSAGWPGP